MRIIPSDVVGSFGQEVDVSFKVGTKDYITTNIYKARIYYDTCLFSTMMNCLDITLDDELSEGDIISNFAVSVTQESEVAVLNYGNFIVQEKEKDAESGLYEYHCYDNMLKTMVPYDLEVTYPITLKNYISAVATKLELNFDNTVSFVNDDLVIKEEQYTSNDTYRDVLEDVAKTTASIVRFNGNWLTIGYPNITTLIVDENGLKSAKIGEKHGVINSVVLSRGDVEDNVAVRDEQSITTNGLCEVKFDSVPFMDSTDDSERLTYATNIFNKINGYCFYEYEIDTFGIGFIEPLDVFTLKIADTYVDGESANYAEYPCIATKGEVQMEQSFVEKFSYEKPEETQTDYSITTTEDRVSKAFVKVNKIEGQITALVEDTDGKISSLEQTTADISLSVSEVNESLEKQQTTFVVKTDGAYIQQGNEGDYAKFTQKGMEIYSSSNKIAEATADTFKAPSFTTDNWTIREEGNTLNFFKGGGI